MAGGSVVPASCPEKTIPLNTKQAALTVKCAQKENGYSSETKVEVIVPKPQIGLISAITFGLGCMIGSGIFISPKGALRHSGSVGASLITWAVSGIMSLVMGLVYCELGTRVPLSGGDLAYIYTGVGKIPAFLTAWSSLLWMQTANTAIFALVFSDYLLAFVFGSCTPPDYMRKTIAAAHIIMLGATNAASVKLGVYVQVISSLVKTVALAVIAMGGLVYFAQGHTENLQHPFEASAFDVTSYALAIYHCMYAYSGYVRISEIAEEITEPKKNIPRAIIISVLIVTLINITTNISYFVLIPKVEFLQSNAVAYDWALRGMPLFATILSISVMISIYGANNGCSFSVGRVMYAAGRHGLYPEVFSFLHVDQSHPVFGIIWHHLISLLLLLPGDISVLINFQTFISFIIMLFSCVSLIRLKLSSISEKDDHPKFETHIILPILGFVFCFFQIVAPFVTNPRVEFLYSAALLLGGFVLYVPFIYFKMRVPGVDRLTLFIQLLCRLCPTEKLD